MNPDFGQDVMERSGQGAAFAECSATNLAIFTVVNACGVVVNRAGMSALGNRESGGHSSLPEDFREGTRPMPTEFVPAVGLCETALTLLVTNRKLGQDGLQRLAVSTHTSMARAIQSPHTEKAGDMFFAVTAAEIFTSDPELSADLAWDALLNCMPAPVRTLDEPKSGRS